MMSIKHYWPTVLWALIILGLTVLPSSKIPEAQPWILPMDKLAHFLMFLVFTVLFYYGREKAIKPMNRKFFLFVVTLGVAYGLLIEIGQLFIPERTFSWFDFWANNAGTIAGSTAYIGFIKIKAKLVKR